MKENKKAQKYTKVNKVTATTSSPKRKATIHCKRIIGTFAQLRLKHCRLEALDREVLEVEARLPDFLLPVLCFAMFCHSS